MSRNAIQQPPVRVYRSDNHFVLATPLAGLEPGDITVTIEDNRVTIQGNERGPRQHLRDLLKAEWTIGPYYREIALPDILDGTLANATYGNGVLVLTIPKSKRTQKPNPARFNLEQIAPARGERIGHTGHDIRPMSTREHRERLAKAPKRPAA
jgi:HSP20 family protein